MRAEEYPNPDDKGRFYDEDGKFIAYSTIISTEDQHNVLMGLYALKKSDDVCDAEKLFDMIKEINKDDWFWMYAFIAIESHPLIIKKHLGKVKGPDQGELF